MKWSVLLVDDEPSILLTVKVVLERRNFVVETASSAAEATEKLKSQSFDVVITDMKMETKTSGWDVVRAARQSSGGPAIAILTAYPDLGSDWKNEGATLLLTKPMKGDEFLTRVEELVVRHTQNRQNGKELPAKAGAITAKTC